ncbi:MAG: ATP-binding protein, partial [Solirubrobacteraceae bacterium]|nr:ATP-binding protein [Solirubrobacteraceae bacterium]
INDVLDLSSVQSGEMKMQLDAVALDRVVGETLPQLTPQARALGIALHVGPLDLRVWADATRVRQVVINLVTNAIKYNRTGGDVWIAARVADDERVALSVRDTGRGIEPAQLPHLFEPFNRLGMDREGIEGNGIGLAVVKSIVERLGGEVVVASTLGVGSEFTVMLENAQGRESVHRPAAPPAAIDFNDPRFTGKLLYIEDNPVNVLIVEELIRRFPGLTLHTAVDGAHGVALTQAVLPDIVMIDMQLPDFDGLEVLRRLRADPRTVSIPCVALSANAIPDDIARALHAGMADYWTKPIDFRVFAASLGRILARSS